MRLIYVAGAYRAKSKLGVILNILKARKVSYRIWKRGDVAICPHMNTALFDGCVPDSQFLEGDIEILLRCDGIYMVKGWENSIGAKEELWTAIKYGLTVEYEDKQPILKDELQAMRVIS